MKFDKNMEHFKKTENFIPLCSQTFSKSHTQFSFGYSPIFAERAEGCYLWDVDGNQFIDYVGGLGAISIGYNNPEINKAIIEQLHKGITFTLPHKLETKLAEMLSEIFPCADMTRFGKNGSDATTGAIRVARAYTGRNTIAICGYHGWHDWYICTTSRNEGIPPVIGEMSEVFNYNDITSLEKIFAKHPGDVAAVILEPIGVEFPKDKFLEKVRDLCDKNGALLIFDEIVTGFRLALGGGQEYFKVVPDLATTGKGMANGMPISALMGKRKIMKKLEDVFFSFTFGGEALSIAASIATIHFIKEHRVIREIHENGKELWNGMNHLFDKHDFRKTMELVGYPPRQAFHFFTSSNYTPEELKTLIQELCHERNLIFLGVHNLSYSHTKKVIKDTLEIYDEVFRLLSAIIKKNQVREKIRGRVIQSVFRKL